MRPYYSSSESLKLLEERSLSSEFQPLEELKLQQEELQLAFRKDFPGGMGAREGVSQRGLWEGAISPSLLSPGTQPGCGPRSCPETGCWKDDLTFLPLFLQFLG